MRLLLLSALLWHTLPAAVSPLHPRIYVRNDNATIGKAITVRQLRMRAADPAFERWRRPVKLNNASAAVEIAARYLEQGQPADLAAVRDFLLSRSYSFERNDVGGLMAGGEMMTAYDWIYNGLTPEERSTLAGNLVKTCAASRRFIEHGGPDVNHNYVYMALTTVATAGLVLTGEPEPYGSVGREYLKLATDWLEEPGRILDTWQARQGAWGEGSHYTFHETLRNLVLTLSAFRSASSKDYYPLIHRSYGDFMKQAGCFLIGSTRPDLTFIRTGDTQANRATANLTVPLTVEMIADGLDDPVATPQLHAFANDLITAYGPTAVHPLYNWGMRLFWSPDEPREPSYRELPTFLRFGAGTLEQFMIRGGWSGSSTYIAILGGNQFTDHQHFDKGQFLIFHRGGLAIDSGAYDAMYKPGRHANEYAPRTVAHNALLVYDPQEQLPPGYTNDGGQRIIRNAQHHGTWPEYVAHREAEGLDAGRVTAADAAHNYVRLDLTHAYSRKVTSYQRIFVYLPQPDALVVYDRLTSAKPFQKRWLLHMQTAPQIDGAQPAPGIQSHPGARWVVVHEKGSYERGGTAAVYDGALFAETLLPGRRDIISTGGPGYEFYSTFAGHNYPVSNPKAAAAPRESGEWRIEVSPADPSTEDRFLNILHMAEGGAAQPAPSILIKDPSDRVIGAAVVTPTEDYIVLCARAVGNRDLTLPVEYAVTTGKQAIHTLTELPPSADVAVVVNGKVMTRTRVNANGVLSFRDPQPGRRRIRIRPLF
ncbi:MAG: heparinase II/III family protein [Bryobacterales bacterium]|nr:heparinase II/III family protein [Bryobacterales bacterium]